jgi:hypothetical protein
MLNENWLQQIDSKFREEGFPPERRAIEALSLYSKEYRSPQEDSETATAIVEWFQQR